MKIEPIDIYILLMITLLFALHFDLTRGIIREYNDLHKRLFKAEQDLHELQGKIASRS